MKLAEDIAKVANVKKKTAVPKPLNSMLFGALKELRLSIASEQRVPAFVIFSDSTLIDMCMKLPSTNEELLEVSGVGQVKLERYGKEFLRTIAEFIPEGKNSLVTPTPETPTDQQPTAIELSDEAVTISVIADRLNCHLLQCGHKKLTGAKINEWLISEGYLEVVPGGTGNNVKKPTSKGTQLGIAAEERVIRGVDCHVNFYGRSVQDFIVARVMDILQFAR